MTTMSYEIVEIIALVLMALIITWSWCKNENSMWKSLLFTALICGIFYLNTPNFLSIIEGTEPKNVLFSFPFTLYNKYGTPYIILTNLLLTLVGLYLGQGKNNRFSSTKAKEQFDQFIVDATKLKIIGRDLDFLLDSSSDKYRIQREKISNLRNHAMLLCSRTNDEKLIELYHTLLKEEIQIRAYTSRNGIANLKGQIKIDEHNDGFGLFVSKISQPANVFRRFGQPDFFEITEIKNAYLLDAIDQQFDKTFDNALHPVIRCIALDLGGVYFDGDIDIFYKFLRENYSISIKKKGNDRLNIDNNLMLGKITIREFITQRVSQKTQKATLNKLTKDDWENILSQWQNTWHPNTKIKEIIMELSRLGYAIVPFSNLDKQNGEKYIREHDLPECCTAYFFSYERKKTKPSKDAFTEFTKFVTEKGYIQKAYQILLIDDEIKNLEVASEQGWETINFYNDPSKDSVIELVQKLKQAGILPGDYVM